MLRLMRLISTITLALALSVILYATVRPAQASEVFSITTDDGLSLTLSEDGQVERQDQVWRGLAWPNGIYLTWLDGDGEALSDMALVAPLHWEANSWRKVSGEVRAPPDAAQMELTIGGRLQGEHLWVNDLSIVASPEVEQPVTGTVTLCSVPQSS